VPGALFLDSQKHAYQRFKNGPIERYRLRTDTLRIFAVFFAFVAWLLLPSIIGSANQGSLPSAIQTSKSKVFLQFQSNEMYSVGERPSSRQASSSKHPRPEILKHGAYARTGILIIPSWFFAPFLRSFSTPMCRTRIGSWSRTQGVNRVDGCNFHFQGGYRWMKKPHTVEVGLGYARLVFPDSNWLGRDEQIPAADFTQIQLHWLFLSTTLAREFPLQKQSRPRWFWKLGGTLMLGMLMGEIYRTKLGAQLPRCRIDDLGNLDFCRPYRAIEFNDSNRDLRYFADCSMKHGCKETDLIRAGRQRETSVPRILPLINLVTGPRVQINDRVGLSTEFGVGLGLNFNLAIDVAFDASPPPPIKSSPAVQ